MERGWDRNNIELELLNAAIFSLLNVLLIHLKEVTKGTISMVRGTGHWWLSGLDSRESQAENVYDPEVIDSNLGRSGQSSECTVYLTKSALSKATIYCISFWLGLCVVIAHFIPISVLFFNIKVSKHLIFRFIAISGNFLGLFEGSHDSHQAVPEPMCLPTMTSGTRTCHPVHFKLSRSRQRTTLCATDAVRYPVTMSLSTLI